MPSPRDKMIVFIKEAYRVQKRVASILPDYNDPGQKLRAFRLIVFSDTDAFFGQPRAVDDGQTAQVTSSGGYNLREQY